MNEAVLNENDVERIEEFFGGVKAHRLCMGRVRAISRFAAPTFHDTRAPEMPSSLSVEWLIEAAKEREERSKLKADVSRVRWSSILECQIAVDGKLMPAFALFLGEYR